MWVLCECVVRVSQALVVVVGRFVRGSHVLVVCSCDCLLQIHMFHVLCCDCLLESCICLAMSFLATSALC